MGTNLQDLKPLVKVPVVVVTIHVTTIAGLISICNYDIYCTSNVCHGHRQWARVGYVCVKIINIIDINITVF